MKKIILILLNLLTLVSSTIVMITSGIYSPSEEGWLFCIWIWAVIVTPILSISFITGAKTIPSKSWLSLYLKRKKLEEQQRITKLQGESK